jgi:PAS domain S-box-containing protein
MAERPTGDLKLAPPVNPLSSAESAAKNTAQPNDDANLAAEDMSALNADQQLEDFFENAAIGLHIVGPDGTILRANRVELERLGYRSEEYVGRNIAEFHADKLVIDDILNRLSHGEKLEKYPARLVARDKSIRHVLITSSVQFHEGRFVNSRCFTMDITDWKRTEDTLKEREKRLEETYEHVNVGISEADADGRFLRVNAALCRITGYSREELLSRTFFDLTHPDEVQAAREMYKQEIVGDFHRYEIEKRFVHKDGKFVWVRVNTALVRDGAGQFLYSVRAVSNIDAQKRAEQRLRDNERRTRNILDSLPVAVYCTDAAGVITYYNKAVTDLTGRAPAIGSDQWCPSSSLFWPDGTPMHHEECPMAVALKENRSVRGMEAIAERPDGTRVPFLPFPSPLTDEHGCLAGGINVLIDLRERKEAEFNQNIMLAELNHRIKNNMQMLHSLLSSAVRETENDVARDALHDASLRLGAMSAAQQILYESSDGARFCVEDFLKSVSNNVRLGTDKEITITIVEAGKEMLPNDQMMPLALILNELITNAAKYGAGVEGVGRVRIGLTRQGGTRTLYVEDEGPGFVFTSGSKRASGLGLVSGLSKQLGGSFKVDRLSVGARCVVQFPVEKNSEQQSSLRLPDHQ